METFFQNYLPSVAFDKSILEKTNYKFKTGLKKQVRRKLQLKIEKPVVENKCIFVFFEISFFDNLHSLLEEI